MTKTFAVYGFDKHDELFAIDISKVRDASRVDAIIGFGRNWYGVSAESPEEAIEAYRRETAERTLTDATVNLQRPTPA